MARHHTQRLAGAVLMSLAASANANEPFPVYPELGGLKAVVLVTSFGISIDRGSLEGAIRDRLQKAGIRVQEGAKLPRLRIDVDTSPFETPLCPGMISLQVRVALEEPVVVTRSPKVKGVRAATWTDQDAPSIVSKADVAHLAEQDVLLVVDRFVYNVSYSTSEYAKWPHH